MQMQEMEARVNSPFHEQPTTQSLPHMIRDWLVLHRSGLAESSKKAVLGSTENTLGRSGTDAGKGKSKGKSRDKRGQSRATGQPTSSSTSQAGMRLHKPRPVPARCTSRDHESDKCPKNLESYMAQALNFTDWCMGSHATYNTTAETFGCENLARGGVLLLDCGATGNVGSE